jgi:hypothetical protein
MKATELAPNDLVYLTMEYTPCNAPANTIGVVLQSRLGYKQELVEWRAVLLDKSITCYAYRLTKIGELACGTNDSIRK